jgi:sugar/nucleoside kinase (ribokinase family)
VNGSPVREVAPPPVLCVGILVADLFVPLLERLPAPGDLIATDDFLLQPGGCAANTAIALRRLGVPVAVCGRVGDDLFGVHVEADLVARGIDTTLVSRASGYGTSKTVVIPVAGEDRRFIHTFGANAALTAGDVTSAALEAAEVVYVGGYLVLPALDQDQLAERFRVARAGGATIALDVVAPTGRSLSLDAVRALLPLTDYFLPNDDEARALTGERDPYEQAGRFLEAGARIVVIKMGARGALVRTARESFEVPAPPVDVIEPSGAGDAFAAGLVLGILEGWSLDRQVRFASVMGASACTALGCWAGVFARDEAEAFLEEHPVRARARLP